VDNLPRKTDGIQFASLCAGRNSRKRTLNSLREEVVVSFGRAAADQAKTRDDKRLSSFEESYLFVYYEAIKRELKRRPLYEHRCDERLKTEAEGSIRLGYTGLRGGLEHLKIETRLIDERFASVMGRCGECVI
jgi:hypothetical protein